MTLDRFDLYERCTQSPADMARVLDAIHGNNPRALAEDFSGTAATARAWLTIANTPRRTAVATDLDPLALNHHGPAKGLTLRRADVTKAPLSPRADIIFVGNFSICELHTTAALNAYISRAAARLKPGGVLVCDLYDGPGALSVSSSRRTLPGPRASRITYTWHQRSANRATRRVVNEIDFTVTRRGTRATLKAAFRYDWKLWAHAALARAFRAAGLAPQLFPPMLDALDSDGNGYIAPVRRADLPKDAVFLVCGRKPRATT